MKNNVVRICKERLDVNTMKIILLKIVAITYPFLADCGARFSAPVVLLTSSQISMASLVNYLGCFVKPKALSLADMPKNVDAALKSYNNGVIAFRFETDRYTSQNFRTVNRYCSSFVPQDEILSMILILADKEIPLQYQELLSGSLILDNVKGFPSYVDEKFTRWLIEGIIKYQSVLRGKLSKIIKLHEQKESYVFNAAWSCFQVIFEYEKSIEAEWLFDARHIVEETIRLINEEWIITDDPDFFARMFREAFTKFVSEMETPISIFDRYKFPFTEKDVTYNMIFFDDLALYISETVFKKICSIASMKVNNNFFKRQLGLAGVLDVTGNVRSYCTSRVWVKSDKDRNGFRIRLMKIIQAKLDEGYEFSLLEQLKWKGEGEQQ